MLQKMVEMGTLTDENGVASTDLRASGLTFSETMTQGFDRVVKKFDELLAKIGLIPAAVGKIPTRVEVGVFGTYHPPVIPSTASADYAASAGLVAATGIPRSSWWRVT